MSFEKFIKHWKTSNPRCSINSRGVIYFTATSTIRYNLEKYNYAIMYYDKNTESIGIEFTNDKQDGIVKIRKGQICGINIGVKSFFDYYGIRPSRTIMCPINRVSDTFITIPMTKFIIRKNKKLDRN